MLPDAFTSLPDLIRIHAASGIAASPAVTDATTTLDYRGLDEAMDRVAAALQRDGLEPGDTVALCATASVRYLTVFLGALRAGAVVAPLSPSVAPASFEAMLDDAFATRGRGWLFHDASTAALAAGAMAAATAVRRVRLDGPDGSAPFAVDPPGRTDRGAPLRPVVIDPDAPFNLIYSSGTTGVPKGIVQPHSMRWAQIRRGEFGHGPGSVTLASTPLYSNTTLVVVIPSLAHGGQVVLMPKFDAAGFLALAQSHRATHAMLVPVQYRRLLALPDFDRHDLSSFRWKFSTSAPFPAELKAEVLRRWPGGLVEYYGMTEGGGTCILYAHEHPDKLHTVGRPAPGHDIRLIGPDDAEVAPGGTGEVVGHSPSMMSGYHRQPALTREAEWFDPSGKRYIRTGDIGRFDADGFLVLLDRRKDVVISGGFNIYPSDLEAVLCAHPAVAEAAVVGVPSEQWGETPVGFVVLAPGGTIGLGAVPDIGPEALRQWANQRLGRMQRLAAVAVVAELPRSPIGKVLKRALRDDWLAAQTR